MKSSLVRHVDNRSAMVTILLFLIIVPTCAVTHANAQAVQPPAVVIHTPTGYGKIMPPDADFTADITSGTAPLTVRFADISLNDPTSWLWDFNSDGRIDAQIRNPDYTYQEPGTYTVSLFVSNSAGRDEETKKGYITVTEWKEAPVADFVADNTYGTVPLTVSFTDISGNDPYSWEWDLDGDGRPDSKEKNPVHTYQEPGFYTVRLTVRNAGGEDDLVKAEYISVLPGEVTEEPVLTADFNEEKPRVSSVTTDTTIPSPEQPPETKSIAPVANPDKLPDLTILFLLIAAITIVMGGYLFSRYRSSRKSSDLHSDLHLELSGGIDFGDMLPPVEDAAEALLPEKDRKMEGGEGR